MKIPTLTHNGGGLRPPPKSGPAAFGGRPTFLETIMGEGWYFDPFPQRGQLFSMMDNYFLCQNPIPHYTQNPLGVA